ncbi:hypothetical protein BK751_33655 [Bacillus thuringiensis serovar galleriae]|nr:hypothetical protein BK701_13960 [Bacillus thuringiensis serovar amagiensis]OTY75058.1 hypothetical protein BK747_05665 [Bacillus thuringiensis serovar azorensis]OTY79355.1 hypothetical protein BK751_33655 [Bacillus thuringiensis serovar galleriae]OTZ40869.1 hypothetical protein BK760_13080 [Bacillus thuringiensis serovar tolworthi]OTZ55873.1 hypothetical protein BK766_17070 [Bacillus thuringiensis serovar wuhanensis]OTZ84699.1 hypothetical protein BK770_35105 [Bacillus thuringiensis serova
MPFDGSSSVLFPQKFQIFFFQLSITVFLSPSSNAFIRLSYSILIYQNYTRSVKHNCYHNNYFLLPFYSYLHNIYRSQNSIKIYYF